MKKRLIKKHIKRILHQFKMDIETDNSLKGCIMYAHPIVAYVIFNEDKEKYVSKSLLNLLLDIKNESKYWNPNEEFFSKTLKKIWLYNEIKIPKYDKKALLRSTL